MKYELTAYGYFLLFVLLIIVIPMFLGVFMETETEKKIKVCETLTSDEAKINCLREFGTTKTPFQKLKEDK